MNSQYSTDNNDEYVLERLSHAFKGRGISYVEKVNSSRYAANTRTETRVNPRNMRAQNVNSDVSYGYSAPNAGVRQQRRVMPVERRPIQNVSHEMTLNDFDRNFYGHNSYRPLCTHKDTEAVQNEVRKLHPEAHMPVRKPVNPIMKNGKTAVKQPIKATVTVKSVTRRAVKKDSLVNKPIGIVIRNFRYLPLSSLIAIVACAVSLMFIIGSSVMLNDASNEYLKKQEEVSDLATAENKLSLQLEVKNDLRTIEDIAVNKLGMVKKDLITREYIKLNDEDVIESYDDDETNVGLTNILSAIGGNH